MVSKPAKYVCDINPEALAELQEAAKDKRGALWHNGKVLIRLVAKKEYAVYQRVDDGLTVIAKYDTVEEAREHVADELAQVIQGIKSGQFDALEVGGVFMVEVYGAYEVVRDLTKVV